jgi:hypothetical protein
MYRLCLRVEYFQPRIDQRAWAAIVGKWLEEVGPRCVGVTAAFLWGGGFFIATGMAVMGFGGAMIGAPLRG